MNGDRNSTSQSHPHVVVAHPTIQNQHEQDEYERRLLNLYIEEIKRTGLIDYPELVEYLNQVYEVDIAPAGTVLMPDVLNTLLENLQIAQTNIATASLQIQKNLHQLANSITTENLTQIQEQELDGEIRQGTERLLKAVEYLLNVTERYVYTHHRGKGENAENAEAEDIRKLMNDLKYIRQYIAEQAQIRVIKNDFQPGDSEKNYFRRLYKYLGIAPGLADILGNLVQQALKHKVAGGDKFVAPKSY